MHKTRPCTKCRHCKLVHGGASLFTLEGVEANPTVHPRNSVTRVILYKCGRLQVGRVLRQRLVRRLGRSEKHIGLCVFYG
uniref:Uncharacterized protein n=1 Tax=Rhizophora mucronata TaxID=61149 RepID=A0A2P2PEH3_RHIMU